MGVLWCCKKKGKNNNLKEPLFRESKLSTSEDNINENISNDITITIKEDEIESNKKEINEEKKENEEEKIEIKEEKKEEEEKKEGEEKIEIKEEKIEIKEEKKEIIEEKKDYIIVENTIYSEKGLNLNENIDDDELLLKEDSPLICDYEKGVITFTHNGFIKLYNSLWNLDNYKSIYDKNNLSILVRYEGTPMNSKFYLIKEIYKIQKTELKYNKDVQSILDYCYDVKFRLLWDEAIKAYDKYEGNDNAFIICTWGKSPVFFVSERETIEKRFRFAKDNSVYIMSTSIPLDIYEKKENVVRFIDFLNLFKVSDEGDYIYFTSLNQVDFKMPIPQMLINLTLPSTSKSWFNNIIKFTNSIKYDRKNKTYERIGDNDEDD